LVAAFCFAWLVGIVAGLVVLANYATRTPESVHPSTQWPVESHLPIKPGCISVVLFLHPRCPCSSATLSELCRILARTPAGCTITIAFFAPTSEPEEWRDTALRRRAASLGGVRIVDDIDAREATLFGAVNSGHVVVFGPDGALRFSGGITASRGHEGDNMGEDCVLASMFGQRPVALTTPTFGCEIVSANVGDLCPLCKQGLVP
jgi:hypothetical protein